MNIEYYKQVAGRLRDFNAWRRGEDDRILQPHPAQIGTDIDTAVEIIDIVVRFLSEVGQKEKGGNMNKVKVVKIDSESLEFSNGVVLTSDHEADCCEVHYLSLDNLTLDDFDGLEFDLTSDNFFERIEGYGIALKPIAGFPIRIPGYGINNGYYSDQLDLVLSTKKGILKSFDISECQDVHD